MTKHNDEGLSVEVPALLESVYLKPFAIEAFVIPFPAGLIPPLGALH